jgi:hypothetical protein
MYIVYTAKTPLFEQWRVESEVTLSLFSETVALGEGQAKMESAHVEKHQNYCL